VTLRLAPDEQFGESAITVLKSSGRAAANDIDEWWVGWQL
jgi:hypothetical protein